MTGFQKHAAKRVCLSIGGIYQRRPFRQQLVTVIANFPCVDIAMQPKLAVGHKSQPAMSAGIICRRNVVHERKMPADPLGVYAVFDANDKIGCKRIVRDIASMLAKLHGDKIGKANRTLFAPYSALVGIHRNDVLEAFQSIVGIKRCTGFVWN
ncbi:hypothetical protein EAO27_12885 [Sphingopyxis sp. YF1]|nr:hypothetical protein EAO27_12885 [Sphingopyxis sp. YF1]